MGNIFEEATPASEPFPEELEEFIRKNPKMNHENLYLCKVVDMDGNVLDTKIGVNLMTNQGLYLRYVDQATSSSTQYRYIYLGRGSAEPDPTSSTLTNQITELSAVNGYSGSTSYYPFEYDDNTKIVSVKYKVSYQYWDYTQGSNAEYEIWEIGIGYNASNLFTHALIYDDHGNQTHITKKPNTRLYITAYWTYSLSVADIPSMYEAGKYVYINPRYVVAFGDPWDVYLSILRRDNYYNKAASETNTSTPSWNSKATLVTNDPREAIWNKGRNKTDTWFWEENGLYFYGTLFSLSYWRWSNMGGSKEIDQFGIIEYEPMPENEEIETFWAYANSWNTIMQSPKSYTGNEINKINFGLNQNFGISISRQIDGSNPSYYVNKQGASLPCVTFDISEMNMYNHISKEWDITVPFENHPEKVYVCHWTKLYVDWYVRYNGNTRHVYVYINYQFPLDEHGVPQNKIISFSNTNMVIAATDTYWDVSSYVEIPNLAAVPDELSRKRYYIVVSGTNTELLPKYSNGNGPYAIGEHSLNLPTERQGYELTHDTTGVMSRIPMQRYDNANAQISPWQTFYYSEDNGAAYDVGSKPLMNNDAGWFLICSKLVYLDEQKNCTEYDIVIHDTNGYDYSYDSIRRWSTKNGDKIILFYPYQAWRIGTSGSNSKTYGWLPFENQFDIYTLTDENTAPTVETVLMQFTDNSDINNNTSFHLYSWSSNGFLVAAKKRTGTEAVVVDIYGDGTNAQQYLLTNAKHCRAIEFTDYCVYQDMNLSGTGDYVFQIYDMKNRQIFDTFHINDGPSYTINGIFGYNDIVYVYVTSDGVSYTFYYNITNGSLEKLTWIIRAFDSNCPYHTTHFAFHEEAVVIIDANTAGQSYIVEKPKLLNPKQPTKSFDLCNTSNVSDDIAGYGGYYPVINTVNDGKQLILTYIACYQCGRYVVVHDLGRALDTGDGQIEHFPYNNYYVYMAFEVGNGCIFPFLKGIIMMSAAGHYDYGTYVNLSGRVFYVPIEYVIPMHMKGLTNTLNSYNAPIRWGIDKKLQYSITNDLSRLLPNNGG